TAPSQPVPAAAPAPSAPAQPAPAAREESASEPAQKR
ncbi:preprotein translocase subunit SecG, partial [Xanthomonas oryzae pv. oryzae]